MPGSPNLKLNAQIKYHVQTLLHKVRRSMHPCYVVVSIPRCLNIESDPSKIRHELTQTFGIGSAGMQSNRKAKLAYTTSGVYHAVLGKRLSAREDHAIQQASPLLQQREEARFILSPRTCLPKSMVLAVRAPPRTASKKSHASKLAWPVNGRERGNATYAQHELGSTNSTRSWNSPFLPVL